MPSSAELIARLEDADFWRGLNEQLTVSDRPPNVGGTWIPDPAELAREKERLATDGYAHFAGVIPEERIEALRTAVERLREAGLQTPFTFVYDEFWQLFQAAAPALDALLGPRFKILTDVWTWFVEPGASGWPSHRDHAKPVAPAGGLPTRVTIWIPLVDVGPTLAPVEVVPLSADPDFPDAMVPCPEFRSELARPMVGPAGSVFLWSANILHRGSEHRGPADQPRIASSTTLMSAGTVPPGDIAVNDLPRFGLPDRLDAIADALLRYRSFNALDDALGDWARGAAHLAAVRRQMRSGSPP